MAEPTPPAAYAHAAADPDTVAAAGGPDARYAVYYAPSPGSAWHEFGRLWLGGQWRPHSVDPAAWARMLRSPLRYGFHATLKAPFRLAPGVAAADLLAQVGGLAARLYPVPLGRLRPAVLEGYVALVPEAEPPGLAEMAARCVLELDALRAPLSDSDLERRRVAQLDDRERELLLAHGYPHVLERFRFHLTLASIAHAAEAAAVLACVREPLNALQKLDPLALDRLSVFAEPRPQAPFVRLRDFELAR